MDNNFIYFKDRQGNYYTKNTKEEIKNIINPFKEDTFLTILKDMDYPYIRHEWNKILDYYVKKDKPLSHVIIAYFHFVNLKTNREYTFKDSQWLNEQYYHWEIKRKCNKYYEVIEYLLDYLEETSGITKSYYVRKIKEKWNLDF